LRCFPLKENAKDNRKLIKSQNFTCFMIERN
jgi:hypothetical protein